MASEAAPAVPLSVHEYGLLAALLPQLDAPARAVAEAVNVPVVASGGCGSVDDMAEVLEHGKASAALAASVFHFGEIRIPEARTRLKTLGVEVRA